MFENRLVISSYSFIFIHLIYSSCQFAKLSESINDGNGCTDG